MVEPIAAMLGADHVIATRMEIADGRYTGGIEYYAYAEEKARANELAVVHGYELRGVLRLQRLGHRRTDARRGRSRARGQPRQGAAAHRDREGLAGAGLHQARRPAPGYLPPAGPTLAALAVGSVVAVGGVLWASARRRRPGRSHGRRARLARQRLGAPKSTLEGRGEQA